MYGRLSEKARLSSLVLTCGMTQTGRLQNDTKCMQLIQAATLLKSNDTVPIKIIMNQFCVNHLVKHIQYQIPLT